MSKKHRGDLRPEQDCLQQYERKHPVYSYQKIKRYQSTVLREAGVAIKSINGLFSWAAMWIRMGIMRIHDRIDNLERKLLLVGKF